MKWLWQLHSQEVGGILGDEMGLGKTVEVIAFLAGLDHSNKSRKRKKGFLNKKLELGAVLVVCPTTVMLHWVGEFHLWWPKMRVAILHPSGSFVGRKETLIKAINNHPGVLITSYESLCRIKEELYRYHWDYVILDEGHKIRNPDSACTIACKKFDTAHRILMTGTPMQNNLRELWSLFDFVFPGRLGTLPVFMTEFSLPITQGGYASASSVQVQTAYRCASVLRDTINPYMLRRLKKDVKQALQLPAKSEQVLFCKLTDEQRRLYKEYITSSDVAMIMTGQMKVFVGLIKLRQLCNHPDLVVHRDTPSEMRGDVEKSGKLKVVQSLLKMWKQQGHRVLLFTQSRQMLNILQKHVESAKYKYMRLDGGSAIGSRQAVVKKFNQDTSIFIFILTTRVGGLGLNLVGANRVIIYDPDWNPSTDIQARERAWRIGQEKDVTIYRLLTAGTVEEKIYHRQIFKQFLTNRVLTNPFQRRFFKRNDLFELFTLGDVGPQQSTETSSIFSGTGSNIDPKKLGKAAKKRKKEKKKLCKTEKKKEKSDGDLSQDCSSCSSARSESIENNNDRMHNNDDDNRTKHLKRQSSIETPDKTHRKKKKSTEEKNTKKKKKKKQKTQVEVCVDGLPVENVEKSETVKKSKEETEKEDISTEDDILFSLFKSSGIHSALKHDKIERADKDDYLFVEKEAERVAHAAITRLQESSTLCRQNNGLTIPTWTGSNSNSEKESKSGKKRPRFGKPSGAPITSPASPKKCKNDGKGNNCGIDISSTALLERMKKRHGATSLVRKESSTFENLESTEAEPTVLTSSVDSGGKDLDPSILAKDIQQYLVQRSNHSASSDEITLFFKSRIGMGNNFLFKEILKRLCTYELQGKSGFWTLKDQFNS